MPMIKTQTPGIYQVRGKRGRVKYRLYINVAVPDPLATSGFRWKLKGKTFAKYQEAVDAKVKTQSEVKAGKYVEPSEVTVTELLEAWLEAGKTRGSPSTANGKSKRIFPTKLRRTTSRQSSERSRRLLSASRRSSKRPLSGKRPSAPTPRTP